LGNAEATLAPAVTPAPARNPRRFIQWPPPVRPGIQDGACKRARWCRPRDAVPAVAGAKL